MHLLQACGRPVVSLWRPVVSVSGQAWSPDTSYRQLEAVSCRCVLLLKTVQLGLAALPELGGVRD